MINQNIVSQSFEGVKIHKSEMNPTQIDLCNRVSNALYKKKEYCKLLKDKNDIDIYMLPKQNGIDIRFLDLYSGNFIKNLNGKALNIYVSETLCRFKVLTDMIIEICTKIKNGTILRPEKNPLDSAEGETDLAKLHPKKYKKYKKSTKLNTTSCSSDNPT